MEETLYEAYGPGGVAIVIKGITDNKNRTLQEIKHIISKGGGSLGNSGSVLWMFGQFGYAAVSSEQLTNSKMSRDDFELVMIDVGAEDIQDAEDGIIEIKTKVENFKKVIDKLKELGIEPKETGLIWAAKDKIPVSGNVQGQLENIFADLEANDDVDDWYTNAE